VLCLRSWLLLTYCKIRRLWNPKIDYRDHKSSSFDLVVSHKCIPLRPIHFLYKIHFNPVVVYLPRASRWFLRSHIVGPVERHLLDKCVLAIDTRTWWRLNDRTSPIASITTVAVKLDFMHFRIKIQDSKNTELGDPRSITLVERGRKRTMLDPVDKASPT